MAVTRRRGRIPVEVFHDRYRTLTANGETPATIALRAGFLDRGRGDSTRLRRALGLAPDNGGYVAGWVTYETAERLLEALGLDWWEIGE